MTNAGKADVRGRRRRLGRRRHGAGTSAAATRPFEDEYLSGGSGRRTRERHAGSRVGSGTATRGRACDDALFWRRVRCRRPSLPQRRSDPDAHARARLRVLQTLCGQRRRPSSPTTADRVHRQDTRQKHRHARGRRGHRTSHQPSRAHRLRCPLTSDSGGFAVGRAHHVAQAVPNGRRANCQRADVQLQCVQWGASSANDTPVPTSRAVRRAHDAALAGTDAHTHESQVTRTPRSRWRRCCRGTHVDCGDFVGRPTPPSAIRRAC